MGSIKILYITSKNYKETFEELILYENHYRTGIPPNKQKRKKIEGQVLPGALPRSVSEALLEEDTSFALSLTPLLLRERPTADSSDADPESDLGSEES
jgi:hypothetical protein